jgi:hypothetical protein
MATKGAMITQLDLDQSMHGTGEDRPAGDHGLTVLETGR